MLVNTTVAKKSEDISGDKKNKKAGARTSGGYQSQFLKDKLEEQKTKSRANRRN